MGYSLAVKTNTFLVGLGLLAAHFWCAFPAARAAENLPPRTARPELALQVGHRMMVMSMAVSTDGNTIVTGSWDGTVKLWDRRTGEVTRTLVASNAMVNSVALASDSPVLASGSGIPATHDDPDGPGDVRVWNAQTGQLLRTFTDFKHPVSHVALSPDGKTLVTVSYQNQSTPPPSKQPQSTENRYRSRQQAITSQIKWWDVESGQVFHTLLIPSSAVTAVALPADGQTLALGTTAFKDLQVMSRDNNGTVSQMRFNLEIRLCDFKTNTVRTILQLPNSQLRSLALSPDGRTLATGHTLEKIGNTESYGPIRLWDMTTGKVTEIFQTTDEADWGDVVALTFSHNGKTLAAAKQTMGGFVQLWDLETRKVHKRIAETAAMDQTLSMAFAPQDAALITAGGHLDRGTVRVWDASENGTGHLVWEKIGLKQDIGKIAFAPDGSAIATTFTQVLLGDPTQEGQSTADVKLWDAKTLRLWKTLPDSGMDIYDIAFAPDSRILASSTFGGASPPNYTQGRIRLWDSKTGKIKRTLTGKDLGGYSLSFAPHGRTIATTDGGEITTWDTATGKKTRTYRAGPFSPADVVIFAPNGRTLVGIGGRSDMNYGRWAAWDTATGKTLWALNNDKPYSGIVAFTPDSRFFATGDTDGKVRLRRARTGQIERVLAMGQSTVIQLAFSPDGKTLACTCSDNNIRLWNTSTYGEPAIIPVESAVGEIAFAPSSRLLAGLTRDGRLCLWDVGKRALKATAEILAFAKNRQGFGSTAWITYTPGGYYVGSAGADSYIRWRADNKLESAKQHTQDFKRPDVVQKALAAE